MLRLIVNISDYGAAANIGGHVQYHSRTFDLDLPQIEKLLTPDEWRSVNLSYELLPPPTDSRTAEPSTEKE